MRVIKRYKNRRLYDTTTGQTITLRDVRELVGGEVTFRVVASTTGADVTLAVLINVLAEEIRHRGNVSATGKLVRLLIQEGGRGSVTILNKTLLAAIGAISLTRENAEKVIDELIKRGELDKSERVDAIKEALAKAEAKSREVAGRIRESVQAAKLTKKYARSADLEALNAKVDRLTKLVEELTRKLAAK